MKTNKSYLIALTFLMSLAAAGYSEVPESVDLGLSVEWAATNLGATAPEDFGGYYGWQVRKLGISFVWRIGTTL